MTRKKPAPVVEQEPVTEQPTTESAPTVETMVAVEKPVALVKRILAEQRVANPEVSRAEVIAACVAAGCNLHTAKTQYQRFYKQ